MRDQVLKQAKRIVVKIGSSLVSSREAGLEPERIDRLADDIALLRSSGREVLIVSSGAIVSGINKLALKEYPKSLPVKQAAAAVGQSRLMWAYEKSFERLGLKVAQILLTHHDLADRRRFLNARHTLTALIEFQVIPIINENDTVAVDEIRVGDNDTLAAEVAHLVDADLLVILSDIDGLFTEDPRKSPSAQLIPLVTDINEDIERRAGVSVTFGATGGMATKVRAAKKVGEYGVATLIVNGQTRGLLPQILSGIPGGTLFLADRFHVAGTRDGQRRSGSGRSPDEAGEESAGFGHRPGHRFVRRRRCGQLSGPGRQRIRERSRELFFRHPFQNQRPENGRDSATTWPSGL
jgi:glutamate 5-kinase